MKAPAPAPSTTPPWLALRTKISKKMQELKLLSEFNNITLGIPNHSLNKLDAIFDRIGILMEEQKSLEPSSPVYIKNQKEIDRLKESIVNLHSDPVEARRLWGNNKIGMLAR